MYIQQEMLNCEEWVLCGNELQQFGSGLEADTNLNREFGPVGTTTQRSLSEHNPESISLSLHWWRSAFLVVSWPQDAF
jgi:hypothetical protein